MHFKTTDVADLKVGDVFTQDINDAKLLDFYVVRDIKERTVFVHKLVCVPDALFRTDRDLKVLVADEPNAREYIGR